MSRDGYLPPGCTQLECDMAQPGYWDPPQVEVVCDCCFGAGNVWTGRMSHSVNSATIDPPFELVETCGKCNGAGGWLEDASDDERRAP